MNRALPFLHGGSLKLTLTFNIFKAVPPITVGLGFKEQIVENLPMDKHDFKIDVVISP